MFLIRMRALMRTHTHTYARRFKKGSGGSLKFCEPDGVPLRKVWKPVNLLHVFKVMYPNVILLYGNFVAISKWYCAITGTPLLQVLVHCSDSSVTRKINPQVCRKCTGQKGSAHSKEQHKKRHRTMQAFHTVFRHTRNVAHIQGCW
jgi:hypothetical protein